MRIWCIEIGTVYDLYYDPWVEASAGGLLVPRVSTAQLLCTMLLAWNTDMYLIAVVKLEIHIKIKDYLPQA